MNRRSFLALLLSTPLAAYGADVQIARDLPYRTGDSLTDYQKERCKLDLYLPVGSPDFPTLVWFHGGGIQGGSKNDKMTVAMAEHFASNGIAVACVNYRLSPKVRFPEYVEDAAASVAWTIRHIGDHGGNPRSVFVGGHSAGGYLTAMVGSDPQYLASTGLKADAVAGYLPVSGQMITHSTVRQERGIPRTRPVIDEAAPCWHASKETQPFLLIVGSDDMPARAEENHYFVAVMKAAGNKNIECLEVPGRNHGTIVSRIPEGDTVFEAMSQFMRQHSR